MLTERERLAVAERIAEFATLLLEAEGDEQVHACLNVFHEFFCGALEAAIRQGRRQTHRGATVSNSN